jgi:hypothetical protein
MPQQLCSTLRGATFTSYSSAMASALSCSSRLPRAVLGFHATSFLHFQRLNAASMRLTAALTLNARAMPWIVSNLTSKAATSTRSLFCSLQGSTATPCTSK